MANDETYGTDRRQLYDLGNFQQWVLSKLSPIVVDGPASLMLLNGVIGVTTEGAEALDTLKKVFFQGHPLDAATEQHIIDELGDVLFYVAEATMALERSMTDVLDAVINKLNTRYPSGFTTKDSIDRDLHAEAAVASGVTIDFAPGTWDKLDQLDGMKQNLAREEAEDKYYTGRWRNPVTNVPVQEHTAQQQALDEAISDERAIADIARALEFSVRFGNNPPPFVKAVRHVSADEARGRLDAFIEQHPPMQDYVQERLHEPKVQRQPTGIQTAMVKDENGQEQAVAMIDMCIVLGANATASDVGKVIEQLSGMTAAQLDGMTMWAAGVHGDAALRARISQELADMDRHVALQAASAENETNGPKVQPADWESAGYETTNPDDGYEHWGNAQG